MGQGCPRGVVAWWQLCQLLAEGQSVRCGASPLQASVYFLCHGNEAVLRAGHTPNTEWSTVSRPCRVTSALGGRPSSYKRSSEKPG